MKYYTNGNLSKYGGKERYIELYKIFKLGNKLLM
jgi:hypothetical protein